MFIYIIIILLTFHTNCHIIYCNLNNFRSKKIIIVIIIIMFWINKITVPSAMFRIVIIFKQVNINIQKSTHV